MKKKIITLVLSMGVMSMLVAGCGNNNQTNTNPSTSQETSSTSEPEDVSKTLYVPDTGDVKVEVGDYTKIDVSNIEKEEVTDAEIQQQIASVLDYYAEAQYLEEGTVENGSIVYLSFQGYIDGELVPIASSEGYQVAIGSGEMIDGFESGLVGHNVGDEVELNLRFPDDYYDVELQGKDIKFDIKILNIVSYEASEWNDEFVAKNLEFASTKEYEAYLKEDMQSYYNNLYLQNINDVIIDYLIENSKVENLPEDEINAYYEDGLAYYKDIATSYNTDYESFVKDYLGYDDVASFESEFKDAAIKDLSYKYIMLQLAKDNGYVLTQDMYDDFISQMADYYGSTVDEVRTQLESSEDITGTYVSALCNYIIYQIIDEFGIEV